MFNALSALKTAAATVAARLFDLKVEKAPAPAPRPANGNGNGHHEVAVVKPVVVVEAPQAEPEDEEDEFQVQSPALGLDQVVVQAAAQEQLSAAPPVAVEALNKAEAMNDVSNDLFVASGNADLDILVAAMAGEFEAPALEEPVPPTEAVEAEELTPPPAVTPKVEVEEAKPVVVAKKPAPPVDERLECKLMTCDEKFSPPKGYTRGYCRACDPDGWSFHELLKNSAEQKVLKTNTCHKPSCKKQFVPPPRYPYAKYCPECHEKDVRELRAAELRRAEARKSMTGPSSEQVEAIRVAEEARVKAEAEKAEAASQLRLQAEGHPKCPGKMCGNKYFIPFYEGAEYCHKCWRDHKYQLEAKAAADHKARLAANQALADRGILTETERARRFEELKKLFVAGKEMPEGVALTRSGTQLLFVVTTKALKADGTTPKKLSLNGHCPLTERELADAEAHKAEMEATKRRQEAAHAEAERARKALEAKKKDLAERYLAGTLPEGVTAESIMEAGSGKKAEAKPKVRFSFADGSEPIVMDPPVKEEKSKAKKGDDKSKKKGKK